MSPDPVTTQEPYGIMAVMVILAQAILELSKKGWQKFKPKKRLPDCKSDSDAIKVQVAGLKGQIAGVDTRVSGLKSETDRLEKQQYQTLSRLAVVEHQSESNNENFKQFREDIKKQNDNFRQDISKLHDKIDQGIGEIKNILIKKGKS